MKSNSMKKETLDAGKYVIVKGARTHNLKNIDIRIPRNVMVVFTGVSGSGKSSLAFGTLYAEAQRRYLESISPYARRLINQMAVPQVEQIDGLPPAIALQQNRGGGNIRSSVGSLTTLSSLLRLLYSRGGDYPEGQQIIYADGFSSNNPAGACPYCQGIGRIFDVSEKLMVPDDSLTIREKAIAAWPNGWNGKNQREILTSLGYDVDVPWKELPEETRRWILYTDDQPEAPVYRNMDRFQVKEAIAKNLRPNYVGTFTSVKRHLLHTLKNSPSAAMKKRAEAFMMNTECPKCNGKKLKSESLSVTFDGLDIVEMSRLSIKKLNAIFLKYTKVEDSNPASRNDDTVVRRIAEDVISRLEIIIDLGLGHLTLERSTPTLSAGELQRIRLATQVRSNLFGVTYVLDEPSAGLHPSDTQALLRALDRLKSAGNSVFVVEHEVDVIRHAQWIVDVGPLAGEQGGNIVYSGLPDGIRNVEASVTGKYLYRESALKQETRAPRGWIKLSNIKKNNLTGLNAQFPLGVFVSVTGVSGSGKSTLVSHALTQLVSDFLGTSSIKDDSEAESDDLLNTEPTDSASGQLEVIDGKVSRLIIVDQKPIGRTPRSNLATYTGLFDHIRSLFANTAVAKQKKYPAAQFSFNVPGGRCENCKGEGSVMVEMLFLPSVYSPCPVCNGLRYRQEILDIKYNRKNIAQVLSMTVDEAFNFFSDISTLSSSLDTIRKVGLGYLRLGQPATELSGGEAQRLKLSTELQRVGKRDTLYVLDEPTTGLHPADVEKLLLQLNKLVDAGNTVISIEHDMEVLAQSDWIIDIGPGAGPDGGKIVAEGKPTEIIDVEDSITSYYMRKSLDIS
ncbi:excinuclease ABC subunit UvrA [Sphingobacterium populi]|nr:excinuclease ABC subunit UvrA [Sphingobacterium sp. CFCC 11742]